MARTNVDDIKAIVDTTLADPRINAAITMASQVMAQLIGDQSKNLLDDTLKEIERYLAAHFITVGPERQVQSRSVLGDSVTFTGRTGMALDATTYGQQAQILDTTGSLAKGRLRGAYIEAM